MASPTLRSSSSTAPGPSLSRSATSMRARPSTAETLTGTSNSASRSAAPRVKVSDSDGANRPASSTVCISPLFSRSGSGTLLSSSAIYRSPEFLIRCRTGRQVTGDRVIDGGKRRGLIAIDAAVGPFDAAIAGRHIGVRHHHQPALEATRMGGFLELLLGGVVDVGADAHHDV